MFSAGHSLHLGFGVTVDWDCLRCVFAVSGDGIWKLELTSRLCCRAAAACWFGCLHAANEFTPAGADKAVLTGTRFPFVLFPGSEAAAGAGAGEGKSDRDVRDAQRARAWTEPGRWFTAAAGVCSRVALLSPNGANGCTLTWHCTVLKCMNVTL